MKKKSILGMIAFVFGLFFLASCDSSDSNEGEGTLIGSWIETRIEGWELDSRYGREDLTENVDPDDATVIIFNADNTYTEIEYPRESTHSGTYSYDAEKKELTMKMGYYTEVFKVEKLSASTLILVDDEGENGYTKTIYKRRK